MHACQYKPCDGDRLHCPNAFYGFLALQSSLVQLFYLTAFVISYQKYALKRGDNRNAFGKCWLQTIVYRGRENASLLGYLVWKVSTACLAVQNISADPLQAQPDMDSKTCYSALRRPVCSWCEQSTCQLWLNWAQTWSGAAAGEVKGEAFWIYMRSVRIQKVILCWSSQNQARLIIETGSDHVNCVLFLRKHCSTYFPNCPLFFCIVSSIPLQTYPTYPCRLDMTSADIIVGIDCIRCHGIQTYMHAGNGPHIITFIVSSDRVDWEVLE